MSSYLEDTVQALNEEIAEARRRPRSAIRLDSGALVGGGVGTSICSYRLDRERSLPLDTPMVLRSGDDQWDCEALTTRGIAVELAVVGLVGEVPENAELISDPIFLLERLRDRVDALVTGPAASGGLVDRLLRLLDGAPADSPRDATPAADALDNVNDEQRAAVASCLAHDVSFVWGPPGTGKTSTLGRVVQAAKHRGEDVLVLAHSNVAVDAALQAAVARDPDATVRAGTSALRAARELGRDATEMVLAGDPELRERLEEAQAAVRENPSDETKEELRTARSEVRAAEDRLLATATVVCATLSKLLTCEPLTLRRFSQVIVDEVSMAFVAQMLVAADSAADRLAFFGDPRQLPPICVAETDLVATCLRRDVFVQTGRDDDGQADVVMLRRQYRMAPAIRRVVSQTMYDGRLLDGREPWPDIDAYAPEPDSPVVWVDVAPMGARRLRSRRHRSRYNIMSAIMTYATIAALPRSADVVVLTPYRPQASLLRALMRDGGLEDVDVGTIHRYQGGEADVVAIDLVDAGHGRLGRPWQGDAGARLLNVAMSRARTKLILVGDPAMSTAGMTPRTKDALSEIRRAALSPVRPTGRFKHGDASLTLRKGLPASVRTLKERDLVGCVAPRPRAGNPGPSRQPDRSAVARWSCSAVPLVG